MTHTRYWAMTLATAVAGAFIAIERFAFSAADSIWITFAVALAATVCALGAFGVALLRENRSFSGMSALGALVGGFTVIAMRAFTVPTAMWVAFAGGIALALISLRALALHETTVERVTYALEHGVPVDPLESVEPAAAPGPAHATGRVATLARRLEVSAPMRSWTYWLALTGIAVAGAFIVLMSFALNVPGTNYDTLRWLSFGVGIATGLMALGALLQHVVVDSARRAIEGRVSGRLAAIVATSASLAVSLGMIVTMVIYSTPTLRWIAFATGLGLACISLVAQVAHELTSERVRHELEVSAPARVAQPGEHASVIVPSA